MRERDNEFDEKLNRVYEDDDYFDADPEEPEDAYEEESEDAYEEESEDTYEDESSASARRDDAREYAYYDEYEEEDPEYVRQRAKAQRERQASRHARDEERRRKRDLRRKLVLAGTGAVALIVVLMAISLVRLIHRTVKDNMPEEEVTIAAEAIPETSSTESTAEESVESTGLVVEKSEDTIALYDEIESDYAILIDLENRKMLSEKSSTAQIAPASMTKVLTILVASDLIGDTDLSTPVTVGIDATDYAFTNDCSIVGFEDGEVVPLEDLFYGTILCSGADAAVALADYCAGSQDAFVEKMNEKLVELGIADTAHFTNCVGVYDDNLYCTVYDMAVIMDAALKNPLCEQAMHAHTYTTAQTEEHPDGLLISNWFLRRIEDRDCGGVVECAKTGYVMQSGNCAVSSATGPDGKTYLCVTAKASSSWRAIADHVLIYQRFFDPAGYEVSYEKRLEQIAAEEAAAAEATTASEDEGVD